MSKLLNEEKNIKLTRFLYIYDEVKYSLLISLTFKTSFDEVLFWLAEIYESGFEEEIWQFTYSIYYNFYSIDYPKLLSYFIKQHKKWESEHNYSILIKCYKNMFYKNVDTRMFHIYILSNQFLKSPNKNSSKKNKLKLTVYKGRTPTICKQFDNKYKHFIQSLEKQNAENIAYYMYLLNDGEFIQIITQYIYLKKGEFNENPFYENRKLNALFHYFIQLKNNSNSSIILKSKSKNIYLSPSKNDIKKYKNVVHNDIPVYKILETKMLYPIRNEVAQFQLSRDSISFEELQELYWKKWEVLCYFTPCWKKIFNHYGITMHNNTLIYPNDDVYNEFWDKYNYDFDEQSKNIQMRTLKPLIYYDYVGIKQGINQKMIY